jgi:RHS repeat-associated protein
MSYGNPGTSTDYTYDANGNMNQDKNKGISSIAYNYLNLPKLITFANGNTIEYIYDATGVKLEKIVKESGQTDKITDYVGGVVYEGNVRKFMSTEEGRIMLESTPEYQYHMKDHLGNVRLTFTTASSAQQTSTYLATMETEVTTLEAATFNNIEATQTEDKIYNHTPGGKASARLNAVEDRVMGPSMTLQVMPGDTVRMKVQAKYFKKAKSKDPIAGMASIVAASMGAGAISEAPQIAQGIQETLGLGQAGLVSKDNTIPKAYINYLFFDKENTFKKGGYKQVSEAALGSFEELDLEYVPEEEGTIMIYTANQTAEDLDVYMDDLTILHTEGPIIRVDDYYPFGMTYHTSERTGYTANRFLYNGIELQEDLELGLYQTMFRMYDPALGRFTAIDPLGELFPGINPYSFALNDPISLGDPDGLGPINEWLRRLFNGYHGNKGSKQARRSSKGKRSTRPGKKRGKSSQGSPTSPTSPSRDNETPRSLSSLGINSTLTEPDYATIKKVEIPSPKNERQNPIVDGEEILPGEKKLVPINAPFGGSSDKLKNLTIAKNNLNEIAQNLIKDPRLSFFIVGNVITDKEKDGEPKKMFGYGDDALDQTGHQVYLNGEPTTFRKMMNARAKAIYDILIDLGVDESQLDYGPGGVLERGSNLTGEYRH